jgi:hypothetical protein
LFGVGERQAKTHPLPREKMKEDPRLTEEERVWLSIVRRQVRSLHFGVVQIVVHDARVVQIERTEKLRLNEALRLESEGSLRSMEGI